MHIAFAIGFICIVGLSETLRYGFFGMSNPEANGLVHGALLCLSFFLLRGDLISVVRRPIQPLYGDLRLNWTWPRTLLGLCLAPMILVLPIAYGLTLTQINVEPVRPDLLVETLIRQVLFIALAEELFFRETALKAYGANLSALVVASSLACFTFHLPGGVPVAMMAAGLGLFALTLRLIGTSILAVIVVQGALAVVLGQVLSLGLTGAENWTYAIYFTVGSIVLSLTLFNLFVQTKGKIRYA